MFPAMPRAIPRAVMILLALLCLCACGGKKAEPEREPLELDILFMAEKDMNPNQKGRPSPLAVKVFELKATSQFEDADYFSLQTDAKTVLADELAAITATFVIRPGARKQVRKIAAPSATALGIIAGYRDIDGAIWQMAYPLPVPPEVGWFSSPAEVRLQIRLMESDIQVLPQF